MHWRFFTTNKLADYIFLQKNQHKNKNFAVKIWLMFFHISKNLEETERSIGK